MAESNTAGPGQCPWGFSQTTSDTGQRRHVTDSTIWYDVVDGTMTLQGSSGNSHMNGSSGHTRLGAGQITNPFEALHALSYGKNGATDYVMFMEDDGESFLGSKYGILQATALAKQMFGDDIDDIQISEDLANRVTEAGRKFKTMREANKNSVVGWGKIERQAYEEFIEESTKMMAPALISPHTPFFDSIEDTAGDAGEVARKAVAEILTARMAPNDNPPFSYASLGQLKVVESFAFDANLLIKVEMGRQGNKGSVVVQMCIEEPDGSISRVNISSTQIPDVERVADFARDYVFNVVVFWCYQMASLIILRRLLGDSV
jgi:hypothetical protein